MLLSVFVMIHNVYKFSLRIIVLQKQDLDTKCN